MTGDPFIRSPGRHAYTVENLHITHKCQSMSREEESHKGLYLFVYYTHTLSQEISCNIYRSLYLVSFMLKFLAVVLRQSIHGYN